jgi:hypothetical protein
VVIEWGVVEKKSGNESFVWLITSPRSEQALSRFECAQRSASPRTLPLFTETERLFGFPKLEQA